MTSSTPPSGEVVNTPITQVQVDFSGAFDKTSIEASDLSLNGTAADGYQILDSDSILFEFNTSPIANQGLQTMSMRAGAILRESENRPLRAWTDTFYHDAQFDSGTLNDWSIFLSEAQDTGRRIIDRYLHNQKHGTHRLRTCRFRRVHRGRFVHGG